VIEENKRRLVVPTPLRISDDDDDDDSKHETCHEHQRTVARPVTEPSVNQYGACHAVEYRSPPRRSRRRSWWPAREVSIFY
jgi:hypothetical protein